MAREIKYVNNKNATATPTSVRPIRYVHGKTQQNKIVVPPAPTFINERARDIKALTTGEVSIGDVASRIPGVAARGAKKTVETVLPAATNFVKTTGGIIGEGVAYAVDKNVREQYRAGNLDILPNVTKTTGKKLFNDTVAAGLEAAIVRGIPGGLKKGLATRAGIGGLEGIGFAVAEGMAKDKSVEEMIQDAKLYGASAAALNVAIPWLTPLLKKEIGRAPKTVISKLKEESKLATEIIEPEVKKTTNVPISTTKQADIPQPQIKEPAPASPAMDISRGTKIKEQPLPVPGEQIPIGGPTKGASRLEARLVAEAEDPARQAGVSNYSKYSSELDAPEITGSSNIEQIRRAAAAVDNLNANQINDIVGGQVPLPDGVLRTSFIKAATEKALLEGDISLVNRLGRVVGQAARRFGQEIQFTKNFDQLDPVTNIADILSVRLKAAERKLPKGQTVRGITEKTMLKVKKDISLNQIKIQQAEELLDSILC